MFTTILRLLGLAPRKTSMSDQSAPDHVPNDAQLNADSMTSSDPVITDSAPPLDSVDVASPTVPPDLADFTNDMAGMFRGAVADLTNPEFQQFIQDTTADAISIVTLQASGADPVLIERARAAVAARAETLTRVPGLIAASRQANFIRMASSFSNVLVGFGFNLLRTYTGLPPVTPV